MNLDPKNPLYKCGGCGWCEEDSAFKDFRCPKCGKSLNGAKSKMLFVDDRTKRIHHALNNFPEFDVTIATCVPEALREMSKNDFDVISLDHDLNGYDFQNPDDASCGMEIVRYIGRTGWPTDKKKPKFMIHSSNSFAAHLMFVELDAQGFFVWYESIVYKAEA